MVLHPPTLRYYLINETWINNYNILGFLLELAANDDTNSRVNGAVKQVTGGIPFDYKEKHMELFSKEAIIGQIDDMYTKGTYTDQGKSNSLYNI